MNPLSRASVPVRTLSGSSKDAAYSVKPAAAAPAPADAAEGWAPKARAWVAKETRAAEAANPDSAFVRAGGSVARGVTTVLTKGPEALLKAVNLTDQNPLTPKGGKR